MKSQPSYRLSAISLLEQQVNTHCYISGYQEGSVEKKDNDCAEGNRYGNLPLLRGKLVSREAQRKQPPAVVSPLQKNVVQHVRPSGCPVQFGVQ
jgi:hypothetical protein